MLVSSVIDFLNVRGGASVPSTTMASMLGLPRYTASTAKKIAGVPSKNPTGHEWVSVLENVQAMAYINNARRRLGLAPIEALQPRDVAVEPRVGPGLLRATQAPVVPPAESGGLNTTDIALVAWLQYAGLTPSSVDSSASGYGKFHFSTDHKGDLKAAVMAFDGGLALVEPKKFLMTYRGVKRQSKGEDIR